MEKVSIRSAVPEDAEILTGLESRCFPPQEAADAERIRERTARFADRYLILERNGKALACMGGCCSDEMHLTDDMYAQAWKHDAHGDWQMIFSVCTLPEAERQGCAARLIRAFQKRICEEGRRGLVLTCKPGMRSFYASFGFRDEGISASLHGGAVWHEMRWCPGDPAYAGDAGKPEMRAKIRAGYRHLRTQEMREADLRIRDRLLPFLRGRGGAVFLYRASGDEVSLQCLGERLLQEGVRVGVPRCAGHGIMECVEIDRDTTFHTGRYGLEEADSERVIPPGEIGTVLVPCVALDPDGYRLGQGGGYYDRFLPRTGALRVGVSYAWRIRPVPRSDHDIRMDLGVTDLEWMDWERGAGT